VAKERFKFDLRAEFFNVFNHLFLANPIPVAASSSPFGVGSVNPATPTVRIPSGALSGGYGFINTFNGNGSQPRTGQIVGRFSF
jgi:hypothetical protein